MEYHNPKNSEQIDPSTPLRERRESFVFLVCIIAVVLAALFVMFGGALFMHWLMHIHWRWTVDHSEINGWSFLCLFSILAFVSWLLHKLK